MTKVMGTQGLRQGSSGRVGGEGVWCILSAFFCPLTLNSQDLVSNSPYCLPYKSCGVRLEHLVFDQLIIP